MTEPDPKDYPNRVNAFVRDMRTWLGTQNPFLVMPPDLEALFTPLSVQEAHLQQVVAEIQRRHEGSEHGDPGDDRQGR